MIILTGPRELVQACESRFSGCKPQRSGPWASSAVLSVGTPRCGGPAQLAGRFDAVDIGLIRSTFSGLAEKARIKCLDGCGETSSCAGH